MRAAIGVAVTAVLLAFTATASAQTLFGAGHDPTKGALVFRDKKCATCHSIGGKGGGRIGPDLAQAARGRGFYDLAAALWNHAPRMASRMREAKMDRPLLTPEESGNLAAYLYTFNYFDRPGDPAAGRKLFTAKRCVSCHKVGGAGGSVGPALDTTKMLASPIALASAMWNHSPQMTAAMQAAGVERPTFAEGELPDLIAFLQRASPPPSTGPIYVLPGRPDEGARLFATKRCVECHSASGVASGEMNLAEREAHKSLTAFAAAMWNKLPRMAEAMRQRNVAFQTLRPDEMADIVAFLYSVRYFADAGDPRAGVILATYKGCLTCHAIYGEPGKPASDLTRSRALAGAPAMLAALWNHAYVADPRTPAERADWHAFTGRQMADLFAYLRTLRRTP
jgi:cytochrome c2